MDQTVSDNGVIELDFAAKYQAAIPAHCEFQTFNAHREILMLCWGLAHQVKTSGKPMECGMCEFNTSPEGRKLYQEWLEERRKQRVWEVISTP